MSGNFSAFGCLEVTNDRLKCLYSRITQNSIKNVINLKIETLIFSSYCHFYLEIFYDSKDLGSFALNCHK